jgi:uncharacterized protein (DUF1778 family)
MKRMNLRLSVTEAERDMIRRAAANSGYRSMAAYCHAVITADAEYREGLQRANVAMNVAEPQKRYTT